MIADYYLIKKQQLNIDALFDDSPDAEYHYNGGFNRKAILLGLSRVISRLDQYGLIFWYLVWMISSQTWAAAADMLG